MFLGFFRCNWTKIRQRWYYFYVKCLNLNNSVQLFFHSRYHTVRSLHELKWELNSYYKVWFWSKHGSGKVRNKRLNINLEFEPGSYGWRASGIYSYLDTLMLSLFPSKLKYSRHCWSDRITKINNPTNAQRATTRVKNKNNPRASINWSKGYSSPQRLPLRICSKQCPFQTLIEPHLR